MARKSFWSRFGSRASVSYNEQAGGADINIGRHPSSVYNDLFGSSAFSAEPSSQREQREAPVSEFAETNTSSPQDSCPIVGKAGVRSSEFASPFDLRIQDVGRPKVLGIGSCFLQSLVGPWAKQLELDFILVNEIFHFPVTPPENVSSYDFQIIQVPLRVVLRDNALTRLDYNDERGYAAALENCQKALKQHLTCRLKWNISNGIPSFVLNFMEPQFNYMGRFQPRFDLRDPGTFVQRLNEQVEAIACEHSNVFVLDVDRLAASFGRRYVQDDSLATFNHNAIISASLRAENRIEDPGLLSDTYDLKPGTDFRAALLSEFESMVSTLRQLDAVKLVVVDLDDTLWSGVSGDAEEIGPNMIEGWPIGFIESLLYLKKRGILLAIVSKNDEARIDSVWSRIFGQLLRKEDFALVRINWKPKSENMREILSIVNVLPRNVLFVDDNPVERAQMESVYPGLRTLGSNPFQLRRIMILAAQTQVVHVSGESVRRTEMVQAQVLRETEREGVSPADFAKQQNIRVKVGLIRSGDDPKLLRCFELVNKTNQFNTTGLRWLQPCFRDFLSGQRNGSDVATASRSFG